MDSITKRAYGKLNLSLDIVGKREDGYHFVRMIMQTVNLYDVITIEKQTQPDIFLTINRQDLPTNRDNLIFQAASLLLNEFHISKGVRIHLEKNIPVAAGMAGGSADCAATLIGINELFSLGLSKEELQQRAVTLGADVPYCILGGTALSEGIGEILTPMTDMVPCNILLVKPNIDVSTKWVYTTLRWNKLNSHPNIDGMIDALNNHSLKGVCDTMGNVLETVTIPSYPVIKQLKDKMMELGAANAMMSGSGPTVFGLFPDEEKGRAAYEICKELYPDFQVEWTEFVSRQQGNM